MRVVVVNNQAPFIRGGAELLAAWLSQKLADYGHEAEVIRLPFQWNPPERVIDHMLAARLVNLERAERLIALKFPAYYVRHDNKVIWLLHQFRQAYDLWDTPFSELANTAGGVRVRAAVIAADRRYLPEARRIYTNSRIVADRLARYSGIASTPLLPPLFDPTKYRCDAYGDYFFFPSRINAIKRQLIAAHAMALSRTDARLVIAGPPDDPRDLDALRDVIHAHDLENRVTVIPRWISDEEKHQLFAGARAVLYLPLGEDSYGYVTLEAFHARKAVITLADSGGTLEIITDGHNGRVVADAAELAQAIDELAEDEPLAARMGDAALTTIADLQISWDHVIACLTG